jgi:hypothetical protein
MKVLTFEMEEVNHRELPPQYIKIKHKNLSLKMTSLQDMEVLSSEYSTFMKEIYPMQSFAYGSIREEYYIREKDKKVFEELINIYIKQAEKKTKRQIITLIRDILVKSETGQGVDVIQELDRMLTFDL